MPANPNPSLMRPARIASLLLSVFLQLAPLVRVAVADTAAVLSPLVALLRWAAGAAAVAGSFHAVSGATGLTMTQGATKIVVASMCPTMRPSPTTPACIVTSSPV